MSENYIVSYLKYRPQVFEDVVGQSHITTALENAINNNHLPQAILFCGSRGTGKTTCARILAKEINKKYTSENDDDFSFNIFELDAASNNSVDDIRALIEQVNFPPQKGKYKVYIIDEVHMLSTSAFNAFLKTLEEPPKHAIFILATTEKHKIIPTILSRCQIFDFKKISNEDIATHLEKIAEKENVKYEKEGIYQIAKKAEGGLRDALSLFDRVSIFSNGNITLKSANENLNILDYDYYFKVTNFLIEEDIKNAIITFNEILDLGFDGRIFISGLASHFRNLMMSKYPETTKLIDVSDQTRKEYTIQSEKIDTQYLISSLKICEDTELNYRQSHNQPLLIEIALMKISNINYEIKKKIEETKKLETEKLEEKTEKKTLQKKESEINKNLAEDISNEFSLQDLHKVKEKEPVKEIKEPASEEVKDFDMAIIENYINLIKEENKALYAILSNAEISFNDKGLDIKVLNKISKISIEQDKPNIINFIRNKIKKTIFINTSIKENISIQKKEIIYTNEDKWKYLVSKNKDISKLITEYGFDF